VTPSGVVLRRYAAADEDAAIELWRRTWQKTYPEIDFTARVPWWRERWRTELVPTCITVAEVGGAAAGEAARMVGFVTVDPAIGYLDQLVVAPEAWGSTLAHALIDAAKEIAPAGLELLVNEDNARAVRFYNKQGFTISGKDVNPRSGKPLFRMTWRP
jgi:putative acetyltransferase